MQGSAWQAVLLTLAITLLNPHVYLDTVVIIGDTLSPLAKGGFLLGAVSASALWFFVLGYGACLLIPLFRRPVTWRLLDVFIGIVMWGIAFSLLRYGVRLMSGVCGNVCGQYTSAPYRRRRPRRR